MTCAPTSYIILPQPKLMIMIDMAISAAYAYILRRLSYVCGKRFLGNLFGVEFEGGSVGCRVC